MRKTWIAMCAVAVVAAAGGIVAGRALAGDEAPKGMEVEKAIDGHALVKVLTANKWNTKATGQMTSTGTVSFRTACAKTVLVEDYDSKGDIGEFSGLGVFKLGADGKSMTLYWLDNHSAKPTEFVGTVSDTGFALSAPSAHAPKALTELKLTKKGDGFEFTYAEAGEVAFTDTYTPAK